MRICIAYDCLFPWTVGGAERWYRSLSERLAADGHDVTYITLRQWDKAVPPDVPQVDVQAVGPRMALYTSGGRRRILPPLVYGAGVLWHLLCHGRRYDVVHLASFPYFSLLAAAAARPLGRYGIVVDWHEVWSRTYWREYLGPIGGAIGFAIQRLCARVRQRAFCFSRLHAQRLREEGLRGDVTVLEGEYAGALVTPHPVPARNVVVFAGRHIPEKRAPAVVPAVTLAREVVPDLRAEIYGDGPDRPAVVAAIAEHAAQEAVTAPGFIEPERLHEAVASALCLLHPSRREGYGLVVVEAASLGVPSIVVREPDNAAAELIEEGVNGIVARSATPRDLADAILAVHAAGPELRASTAEWFRRNARRLSLDGSLATVVGDYARSTRS